MVKLEFENPPPTKEALEESKEAARERVTGKKRKKRSTDSRDITPTFLETADLMTGQSIDPVAVQQQQQKTAEQITTAQQVREQAIKQSFRPTPTISPSVTPTPTISPSVTPTPTETTISSKFEGLSAVELRQAGFEPVQQPSDVQPSDLRAPSQAFVDVKEKLKPSTETTPVRFKELPVAGAVVVGELGVQTTEFLRGAIVDPLTVLVKPVETVVQPLFETGVGLGTGTTTVRDISRGISESVVAEPSRALGNVAFDVVSGKLIIGGRQQLLSELSDIQSQEFFRSVSTGQPFKVPPKKTQVVSQLENVEGLTLPDDVPRGRLIDVKEEFSEGIIPVLDETTSTVKELQVQLVPDPSVKVTAEGLPVSRPQGFKSTASLLEQQAELPSVRTPETDAFRTLFDADVDLGTFKAKEGVDPFMDVKPQETQLPLDKSFEQSIQRPKPRITVERTETLLPSTETSKKLLATPDPVTALFETAVDPEFLSFTQKEFEKLRRGTKKVQADIELPVTAQMKTPDFEFPISASSLAKQPTSLSERTTTASLPDITLPTKPVSEKQLGTPITELSREFAPPETTILPTQELVRTPKQEIIVAPVQELRRKSRSKQAADVVQDLQPVQEQETIITPSVITTPKPLVSPARSRLRPRQSLVPKPRPRPKVKPSPKKSFFTVVIGREGAKVFKTIKASSLREAAIVGKRGVTETAAASLEIRKNGQQLTFEEEEFVKTYLGKSFRKGKEGRRFVQKREFRIGTAGEKKEITLKGLGALRSKSGSLFAEQLVNKGLKLRDVRRLL